MGKPSLPSIQFLLQEAPGPSSTYEEVVVNATPKRQFGHRSTRSVSSLPVDLQSLSLQAPEDRDRVEPYRGLPFSSGEKTPSWMIPNDNSPPPIVPSTLNTTTTHRKKSGHGRSVSEFTLPPLNTPIPHHQHHRTSTHRRAVSANTVDFMLSPPTPATSSSSNPTNSSIRAQSYSPKEPTLSFIPSSSPPIHNFDQQDLDTSGRYVCPYCHKKFSRPSSLRIHTYSHTGEKPFVCTEPGCGRHFSVQSNMRRHLRVHRLGRNANNLETTNEEV
ncbi:hypothetical protein INT47_000307 [Mucor saturninus]|uniref:C2H2-type domain-containing protein n=1 Tax=Mucor saturninus TaxID=64648 RepID=A0A8H7QWZ9_9FUNG|nr:hypothetical protein INT47_000307 [Mucor saturninus]